MKGIVCSAIATLLLALALTLSANAQGTIIEDTVVRSFTVAELQEFLTSQAIPAEILPLFYSVEAHRIVYGTPDPQGNPTYASGLIWLPTNSPCPLPMVSYQHGTKLIKNETFYYQRDEWFLGAIMASAGFAACMPDYLGLGFSPGLHPYQHAESQATATIDLMRVCRAICATQQLELNSQLFLTGYSQGGHATMAVHRKIQHELSDEFTVTASAPGSGAYDLSGHQLDMVASFEPYSQPGYLPYLILAYQSVYGTLYNDISEIFVPPYDEVLPPMFDGTYGMGELNEVMPEVPRQIIVPEYADAFFSDPEHPAFVALRDNDVYDWVPGAPVVMSYCGSDEEVTPLNALFTLDHMTALGAQDVTAVERSSTMSHFECAQPTLLMALGWFLGMAEFCPEGVADVASAPVAAVRPNPAAGAFELSVPLTGPAMQRATFTDALGRTVRQINLGAASHSAEMSTAGLPSGIYSVTIGLSGGKAVRTTVVVAD